MVRIGIRVPHELFDRDVTALGGALARIDECGIDHVTIGDHVSFHDGRGYDGLIQSAALLAAHPHLPVYVAVYLLPLRHPVLVARQLSTLTGMAPGRLVLGIGIGGEDRHEVEITGVDPATRGRRTDESLGALRNLLTGTPVTHHGEFFDFDEAIIRPAPSPSVPIVIGGRSDAAFERVARFGDGWLGAWVSPERFAASVERIEQSAALGGRDGVTWRHGMSVWCGFGRTREEGAGHVAPMIERLYKIDFERFERYTPTGSPEDVAEALVPYVRAGVADLNLISVAADPDAAIQATGEVRRLLAAAG